MNIIDELTEYFRKFPGVGPRQAKRFVYYLLRQNTQTLNQISDKIKTLHDNINVCSDCYQYFISQNPESTKCTICLNKNRETDKILVVGSDIDLKTIEKSGTYNGLYFILGSTVPITDSRPGPYSRFENLITRINTEKPSEIIIALSANPEGEHTTVLLKDEISKCKHNPKISVLGRGLSTGSEIEYSDSETLKNALNNRF
jgi:recombination protein RecR